MIGLKLNVAKRNFFDRGLVVRAVDAATRAELATFGSLVMQRIRWMFKSRKSSAAAGQPPTAWQDELRKLTVFAFDTQNKSLVVGPTLLNGRQPYHIPVPQLLNEGGTVVRKRRAFVRVRGNKYLGWRAKESKTEKLVEIPAGPITIKPHPFTEPALKKLLPRLPEQYRNAIKP